MTLHPDDRPDPAEQPLRARVPEQVAGGCFSTGVIVMTAQTEFVLDFVQNLGRPHQIVARVVLPHGVLPQLVDALGRNIQLYRGRWGELPQPPSLAAQAAAKSPVPKPTQDPAPQSPAGLMHEISTLDSPLSSEHMSDDEAKPVPPNPSGPASPAFPPPGTPPVGLPPEAAASGGATSPAPLGQGHAHTASRQATAEEIYDDLKIRDELLSGVYANAVMIGHGPHEFSFDFITNFYPHSAVSARVFLAAGQIPRLYDSLKGTWEQLRLRMQPPPPPPAAG